MCEKQYEALLRAIHKDVDDLTPEQVDDYIKGRMAARRAK